MSDMATPLTSETVWRHRRTGLKRAFLNDGIVAETPEDNGSEIFVQNVVLQGATFTSPVPMPPGTVKYLRNTKDTEAKLSSGIRVICCRLRSDGRFDIGAEFF